MANEIQTYDFGAPLVSGQYKITLNGPTYSGQSADIAWDASAATIKSAIEAIDAAITATVTNITPNQKWSIEFGGAWANINVEPITVQSGTTPAAFDAATITEETLTEGAAAVAEVQTLTLSDAPDYGTWKPAGTTAVDWDATAGEAETAIETDLNPLGVGVTLMSQVYTVTWDATGNQPALAPDGASLMKTTAAPTWTVVVAGGGGTNEEVDLEIVGSPTAGRFTLDGGVIYLDWDATAGEVETAVEAAGAWNHDVSVTRSPDPPYIYHIVSTSGNGEAPLVPNVDIADPLRAPATTVSVNTTTQGSSGTQEVQRVTLDDGPDLNEFKAASGSGVSVVASAAAMEAYLRDLPSVQAVVSRSGAGTPADPYRWTYTYDAAGNQSQVDWDVLPGPSPPPRRTATATVETTQQGSGGGGGGCSTILNFLCG